MDTMLYGKDLVEVLDNTMLPKVKVVATGDEFYISRGKLKTPTDKKPNKRFANMTPQQIALAKENANDLIIRGLKMKPDEPAARDEIRFRLNENCQRVDTQGRIDLYSSNDVDSSFVPDNENGLWLTDKIVYLPDGKSRKGNYSGSWLLWDHATDAQRTESISARNEKIRMLIDRNERAIDDNPRLRALLTADCAEVV